MKPEYSQMIAIARKERGLTQKKLASMLGVSTGTVQQWELGVRFPRVEMLTQLEKHLKIALVPTVIEENTECGTEIYLNENQVKDCQRRKILALFEQLNENGREIAISIIESLAWNEKYQYKTPAEAPETPSEPLAEDGQGKSSIEQEKPSAGQ